MTGGKLTGKVAIVTGGARGTGAAIARRFVAEGAKVVIADVLAGAGAALAEELGHNALFAELDVGDEAQWTRTVEMAEKAFGTPTILINNAAILVLAPIEDTTTADYQRCVRVNQLGPFLGIRALTPVMKRCGGGSIVNIGSTDGVFPGDQGVMAYAATKWALRGMTKVAAMELGRHGIRVNTVNPDSGNPFIGRPFMPEGMSDDEMLRAWDRMAYRTLRRLDPKRERIDEIVPMVLLLASDDGSACTGGDYPVDGGHSAGVSSLTG